jgi:tetratricopeptide (TPR) repeat protein
LAQVRTGRLPGAEGEHAVLVGLTKHLGRDRTPEEKTERVLLRIAERLLAGEIAARYGKYDDAIKLLKDAVLLEDGLPYAEPPFWPISTRHYLGATLLAARRASDAEEVYRTDLAKYPDNGWASYGLMQSLQAQGKQTEAEAAEQRFKTAWTYADVTLTGSRF